MSLHQTLKDEQHEQEEALSERAQEVEAKRTDSDKSYAKKIDELIEDAHQSAVDEAGPKPPPRDPLRIVQWETRVNYLYHKNIDEMSLARGLRKQSHQLI